ncbi:MAG: imidazole glycerol phosphate synthase subunit HisH [Proteobacteria bacterium]|nr:imidazole glycerol phosphate synthase subunit HisH [Pseudomonadota bacterium]
MKEVGIIKTGVANIASIEAAFERLGAKTKLIHNPAEINEAEQLILPGVGTFGACLEYLETSGVKPELIKYIANKGKLLAICCGFQVLFNLSEESPGVKGLAILNAEVKKFPATVKTPQFGWNEVKANSNCKNISTGYAYFANSYAVSIEVDCSAIATANYGSEFVAGFELDNITALQFHPELSGDYGENILRSWLNAN